MPAPSDPDSRSRSRPWWVGSEPSWQSPWSLEDGLDFDPNDESEPPPPPAGKKPNPEAPVVETKEVPQFRPKYRRQKPDTQPAPAPPAATAPPAQTGAPEEMPLIQRVVQSKGRTAPAAPRESVPLEKPLPPSEVPSVPAPGPSVEQKAAPLETPPSPPVSSPFAEKKPAAESKPATPPPPPGTATPTRSKTTVRRRIPARPPQPKPQTTPELRLPSSSSGKSTESKASERAPNERVHDGPRVSWSGPVFVGIVVLVATYVTWLYIHDEDEVWDEDLRIAAPYDPAPSITAPQRLLAFLDSLQAVPDVELARKPPWEWDTISLSKMLQSNARALDNLKDLLEDANWHGRHAAWHRSDLGAHPKWVYAMILKQAEAAYLDRRREELAAFSAAMDLAELARRLQDLHAWPSLYFRSLEVHGRASLSLAELLRDTQLPGDLLGDIQSEFERCEPMDEQVRENVLPAFYVHEKKLLLGALSGEPLDTMPNGIQQPRPPRLFFKTNETLDMIATTIRYLRDQTGQTTVAVNRVHEIWDGVPTQEGAGFYQPNGAGTAYAAERLAPYLDVPLRHQLARTHHLLLVNLFALRRFYSDKGGLPTELSQLTPGYLAELPRDPFSGNPFQYYLASGLLFSVGVDFNASGGSPNLPPLSDNAEPTLPIGVRSSG